MKETVEEGHHFPVPTLVPLVFTLRWVRGGPQTPQVLRSLGPVSRGLDEMTFQGASLLPGAK